MCSANPFAVSLESLGMLLVAATALPYAIEILRQVPLQARFLAILPPDARAALPPHPRHPWLAPFGSVRFFLALFRYVLRNTPEDPIAVAALKRKMRASMLREGLFAAGLIIVVTALWSAGWRPAWPRFRS